MPSIVHVHLFAMHGQPHVKRSQPNLKSEIVTSLPQAEPGCHLLIQLVESLFQSLNGRMRCCTLQMSRRDRPQLVSTHLARKFSISCFVRADDLIGLISLSSASICPANLARSWHSLPTHGLVLSGRPRFGSHPVTSTQIKIFPRSPRADVG